MSDEIENVETEAAPEKEAAPKKEAKAKKEKPAKVSRKPMKASRVAYKDRHKLKVDGLDRNFEYRWVNTDDTKYAGRVEELKRRGYTLANDDESLVDSQGVQAGQLGSKVGRPVGNGTNAVLMKIPKEYYEEDKVAKRAEVDETEEGMVSEELRTGSDVVGSGLNIQRPQFEVQ